MHNYNEALWPMDSTQWGCSFTLCKLHGEVWGLQPPPSPHHAQGAQMWLAVPETWQGGPVHMWEHAPKVGVAAWAAGGRWGDLVLVDPCS